jgi:hypothetical protein
VIMVAINRNTCIETSARCSNVVREPDDPDMDGLP